MVMMLRSGRRPMFVEIRNPFAVELLNYRVTHFENYPEKAFMRFAMVAREGRLDAGPEAGGAHHRELELRPSGRTLGGRNCSGFSYRYHYRSAAIPIYKILDRGSWEVGGSALGNEFWMRNCFVLSITRIESAAQFYSTEWYIPNCANPSALQFIPLQTELQGFSFTASPAGVLVTWPSEVAHIRSLFEKPRGEEVMTHFHEHCGDLGHEFSAAPVEVLLVPGTAESGGARE